MQPDVFAQPPVQQQTTQEIAESLAEGSVCSLNAILRPEQGPYNVRLLLSGHIHLLDRIEYRGMTFICGGALCGNWWQGAWQGCEPGYGIVDVWPDGRFQHQYVPYADRL